MAANEIFGWVWILCGLLSGLTLGLFFHRDDWLGGYASFPLMWVPLAWIDLAFMVGFLAALRAVTLAAADGLAEEVPDGTG